MTFGAWLKEQLDLANLRPIRFAEVLGANRSTVTRWLRDQSLPDAESSRRIALALGIDPSLVLERAGHRHFASEMEGEVRKRFNEAYDRFHLLEARYGELDSEMRMVNEEMDKAFAALQRSSQQLEQLEALRWGVQPPEAVDVMRHIDHLPVTDTEKEQLRVAVLNLIDSLQRRVPSVTKRGLAEAGSAE